MRKRMRPIPGHGRRAYWQAVALCVVFLAGCHQATSAPVHTFSGDVFGSTYTIKVIAPSKTALTAEEQLRVQQTLGARFDEINRTMSTYDKTSELSQFNRAQDTVPHPASRTLLDVLVCARQVSEETDGAFDVTVAPLVRAWGFGSDPRPPGGPSPDELAALRKQVGYRLIEIDPNASTIRKQRPDVSCDVDAIAPGYAVDRVAEALDLLGYDRYMIEIGGEVRVRGANPSGLPWQIAIEKPLIASSGDIQRVVGLTNAAVSTSGDYRDYYEKDGVRLSHTIAPRTGRPIAHALASVTVMHPTSCMFADAYATALMVLGPDEGYNLAVRLELAAYFVVHEGPHAWSVKETPAFSALSRSDPSEVSDMGEQDRADASRVHQ